MTSASQRSNQSLYETVLNLFATSVVIGVSNLYQVMKEAQNNEKTDKLVDIDSSAALT